MKKIILIGVMLFALFNLQSTIDNHQSHAGSLILDLQTATSGTTTVASGDSIFQISALSGTYTTSLAVTNTVIPNMSNYSREYAVQINDIAFAIGYPESDSNSGTTIEIFAEISNLNDDDAWSGASKVVIFSGGVAMSGNSTYVQSGTLPACDYVRWGMTTGVTPVGRGTARVVMK
uniref:Uncharacterized protein n=1 Tax=viral metagenome TaxID=1070528 RepID=A0A6M3ISH8_9ZZZZ